MLPRITQSSYSAALGRESQIEPWLAVGQHAACRREELPRNDANQMLPQPDPRSGAEPCRRRGAGCQKKPSSKKDGKVFFLDIPFYRTRLKVRCGLRRCIFACQLLRANSSAHTSHYASP